MTTLNLVPAYGRDYKNQKAVKADWEADKDFIINDVSSRWDGKAINRIQLSDGDVVYIRYNKLQRVIRIEVKPLWESSAGISPTKCAGLLGALSTPRDYRLYRGMGTRKQANPIGADTLLSLLPRRGISIPTAAFRGYSPANEIQGGDAFWAENARPSCYLGAAPDNGENMHN